ncbi:MAG: NADH-quinone oxidoreductase subunit F, partial [Spirochaetes bacterium]|nr:NADH-quinone oxidoreductase subunit F [Spirochaetota bacterium]
MKITSPQDLKTARERLEQERNAVSRRIRLCTGGGCLASGAEKIRAALEAELAGRDGHVQIAETGCMGPCAAGPVLAVDPDGTFYEGVTPEDAREIVHDHVLGGRPVERLLHRNLDTGDTARTEEEIDFFTRQHKVVLRNCGQVNPGSLGDYIALGGYAGLANAITEYSRE